MTIHWGLGALPETVGLPKEYFEKRGIVLDCRGPLAIDGKSVWGFDIRVFTQSHRVQGGPGRLGPAAPYGVTVEAGAWIGSSAILAGCCIGAGAIVAAGTVVRGQTVGAGVMVAGNPARVIARWADGRWAYLPADESGYARRLE